MDTNSRFEVAMSSGDQQSFINAIVKAPTKAINKMLASINVANSECFKPEDKIKILKEVEDTVGVAQINSIGNIFLI